MASGEKEESVRTHAWPKKRGEKKEKIIPSHS
jgi:hypothetical protein